MKGNRGRVGGIAGWLLLLVALDRLVMIGRWILLLTARGVAVTPGAAARLFLSLFVRLNARSKAVSGGMGNRSRTSISLFPRLGLFVESVNGSQLNG